MVQKCECAMFLYSFVPKQVLKFFMISCSNLHITLGMLFNLVHISSVVCSFSFSNFFGVVMELPSIEVEEQILMMSTFNFFRLILEPAIWSILKMHSFFINFLTITPENINCSTPSVMILSLFGLSPLVNFHFSYHTIHLLYLYW